MIDETKVFWQNTVNTLHVKGEDFNVKLGFSPTENRYLAIRKQHPKFCMAGETKDEALEKANAALTYYMSVGGLKENLANSQITS